MLEMELQCTQVPGAMEQGMNTYEIWLGMLEMELQLQCTQVPGAMEPGMVIYNI